ncbi:hypothetical protein DC487_04035 [Sphingobacterium corticibacter]|uniref:histidine kinase n=1 Tax=Sphingobacterium corticibacter TaxID=2171749 RepID=A0A2T8HMZ7_9SPHI|nr:hypothetical protein DC487_04035 [Sphingobacterium corticibacter]
MLDADLDQKTEYLQELHRKLRVIYYTQDFVGTLKFEKEVESLKTSMITPNLLLTDIEMLFAKSLYNLSNYERSLPLALVNLSNYEELRNAKGIADARNLLGLIYLAQHHYDAALEEFKKSATQHKVLGNEQRLSANYHNLGLVSTSLGRPQYAKSYFIKAKSLAEKSGYVTVSAMADNRLAEMYENENQLDTAMLLYNRVLQNNSVMSEWENSFAHTGVARCYYKLKQYDKAHKHALQGYNLAVKLQTKSDIVRAAKVVAEVNAALGAFEDAFTYQQIYDLYKDSILSEDKRISLDSMQIAHQRSANMKLTKENNVMDQQLRIGQILLLFLLSLVVFVLVIWHTTRRHANTTSGLNSELKMHSQLITERNALIESQNEQLRDTIVTKDFLIAVLSHDFRSPMSAILNVIQYLENTPLNTTDRNHWFEILRKQTLSTMNVMDNLLLWSETQKQTIHTERIAVNVSSLVMNILDMLEQNLQDKELNIIHDSCAEAIGHVDQNHLQIILSNLISNAAKFTAKGGTIHISYEDAEEDLKIHIRDNGVGMSAIKLQQIQSKDNSLKLTEGTDQERGFGIGMQIITHFLKANGAQLLIESTEGQGSLFTVIIARSLSHQALHFQDTSV